MLLKQLMVFLGHFEILGVILDFYILNVSFNFFQSGLF